ncbi:helix-turn-helix domain-containing protein [Paenibacillus sp. CF384]|uniref:response regulator transcription factor n=1 Tax=Paenibacillus sp. CF384 TaxID=1884382 RepID=UPI00089C3845|nr:helix-turn-helix domain-containing protein [Paenibacillus sp. CF384]SDW85547.1 two-component system, response regulator YesN [Paenibacillus sp. CF384]
MYKAIIIDDEQPARLAIRALGEWDNHGIEIVAEAGNGQEGIRLLADHKPDIVFVDMKMPLMGGEEFLEQARTAHPDACYIVISGFDDFAYARSAMQAGSIDYLLKPIRKAELNDVIERAISLINKRREQLLVDSSSRIYRNLSAPLVKEKIYSSIIDGNGRFHHIRELEAVLGTEAGKALCRVVVFKLLNAAEVIERKFYGDTHTFYYALTNAVDELLGRFGKSFSFKNTRDAMEIVAVVNLSEAGTNQSIGIWGMIDKLTALFTIKLVASEGHLAQIEDLGESYAAALRSLMALNMIDLRPTVKEAEGERPSILDRSNLFEQTIESGSERQAMHELRKWLEEIEASGVVTMSGMLAMEDELRMFAEMLIAQLKADTPSDSPSDSLSAMALGQFDRSLRGRVFEYAIFKDTVLTYFHPLFTALAESRRSESGSTSVPERIKGYIDLHYYEELPVSFFAERFHMSKEHLARTYKQRYGIGIHEYQLHIRMAKAKEWLSDKSLKIQTVSERVGFRDQNYFSKAFKKYTGLTPQEFRVKME